MLKKETVTKFATLLKVKEADLIAAIADANEVDFAVPEDLQVLTQAELDNRDTAQKNEGIKAGKEIGVKEVRTAAGLDEGVGKDPKKIADAIITKAVTDAKVPTDAKVTELTTQNQLLTQKLADKDLEIEGEKKKSAQVATDRSILSAMPKNRAESLQDDEYLDVIKSRYIKQLEDGTTVVVGKDGEPLRDPKTTKPLDLAAGLLSVFTERKWVAESGAGGGRGGKDEKPATGSFSKKSEVIAHYETLGKSMNGEAGQEIVAKLAELAKADPSFDINN